MPRKEVVVLTDDFDGKQLREDTQPIQLSLGRTTYNLYLSDKNHTKLLAALEPFTKDAEKRPTKRGGNRRDTTLAEDKARFTAVRAWAQSTGYTYKNAKGEDTTLGDRGRIPQAVFDAYDMAN